jgi:Flp pilus assembly secretin CpaC
VDVLVFLISCLLDHSRCRVGGCLRIPKPDQKRILETIVSSELLGVRARAVCTVAEGERVSFAVDYFDMVGVLVLEG